MNITLDDLYRMIGELYVANQTLTRRVQTLTPKPAPEPEAETSLPHLADTSS